MDSLTADTIAASQPSTQRGVVLILCDQDHAEQAMHISSDLGVRGVHVRVKATDTYTTEYDEEHMLSVLATTAVVCPLLSDGFLSNATCQRYVRCAQSQQIRLFVVRPLSNLNLAQAGTPIYIFGFVTI